MKIVKLSQTSDTEAWLQARLGKITGSKARKVKPLSRGADRTPQGFWQLLAEKLAQVEDGETDIDRGHRLQGVALAELAKRYKLDVDTDCGMWISDDDEDIAVSPDGAEKSDKPTWAAETKCFSSANHLKFVIKDRQARKEKDYNPIDSVPNDAYNAHREQVIQYFVVNENLKTLYFVLYDDRIGLDHLVFHAVVISRSDIADEINAQKEQQVDVLRQVNELIAQLAKEKK